MSRTVPPRVSYLGPEGSFSSIAARRIFGRGFRPSLAPDIPSVFEQIKRHETQFAVVPVESPQGGTVQEAVFGLCRDVGGPGEPRILVEVDFPVHLCLVGRGPLSKVRRIYSHPQAIARAREWLSRLSPPVRVIGVASTARAAKMVRGSLTSAALAGRDTARLFGLKVLKSGIAPSSPTTFLVLGRSRYRTTLTNGKPYRTSVVFRLRHRPGSLASALNVLARQGINLTRILSIPLEGSLGEYQFLIELAGRSGTASLDSALRDLKARSDTSRLLGSYPLVRL